MIEEARRKAALERSTEAATLLHRVCSSDAFTNEEVRVLEEIVCRRRAEFEAIELRATQQNETLQQRRQEVEQALQAREKLLNATSCSSDPELFDVFVRHHALLKSELAHLDRSM
tara:strand:- start:339 stop:683 length:345 start_codon:yes stop_codon:yes gene_type:complete